ncbi:hypothetical protein [Ramlibacter alkalitolerans]|uniref:Lipoprotein n=1 Tax=Ramlibacter alkalitolerans TaxID=2039631 RepID=A0ABS1JIQ4_9BURK|nr:hypothetical protein [Ramlibacter alkalitolerans]MBL0424108.1 hypothetical protein [Ramlibacter alkalitolerans]
MRKLPSLLLAAALAGCASTPVSQGGKADVLFAGNETIRIRWNPLRTNERDIRSLAVAFCGGRKVEELEAAPDAAAAGSLQVKTWRCETFPGSGSGM